MTSSVMRAHDLRRLMLKQFSRGEKTQHFFTHGVGQNMTAAAARCHLKILLEEGHIRTTDIGYCITRAGVTSLENEKMRDHSIPVRNSTMAGLYATPAWSVRAGGEDHCSIPSLTAF